MRCDQTQTALAKLTGSAAPDDMIEHLAQTVLDYLGHDHPKPGQGEDWHCMNLTAYMGERMRGVLVRLREAETAIQRVRAMHPKIENPTYGCCASPKVCEGHMPECRSDEHGWRPQPWPCETLRALDLKGGER